MRQDEELWMRKMKELLKDYSEPAPTDGWDELEKELTPVTKKRIHAYRWWMTAAAVLLLALSGISLFFMNTPAADEIRYTSVPAISAPDVMPETQKPEAQPELAKPAPNLLHAQGQTSYPSVIEKAGDTGYVSHTAEEIEPRQASDKAPVRTENEGDTSIKESRKEDAKEKQTEVRKETRPSGRDKLHLPVVSSKKASKGKWSVAAFASNNPGSTALENADYLVFASSSAMNDGIQNSTMIPIEEGKELLFQQGLPYLKQTSTVYEMKHKQPVSFGLSVRKNLSKGFSVETGLTYTLLSSEGYTTQASSAKIDQKLHYIGLPVRGNWDFVDSRHFTLYLSAGGMVEKCVYGKTGSVKNTVKPLQFSVAGGIGAQFNASKHVGIYVEPGVSYYFDNGSDVQTIRKDTPFNFNLQAGIRLTY